MIEDLITVIVIVFAFAAIAVVVATTFFGATFPWAILWVTTGALGVTVYSMFPQLVKRK